MSGVEIGEDEVLDYVLGAMEPAGVQAFEAALARDPELAARVREAEELLAAQALLLPPVSPSPQGRTRLLEALVPTGWSAFAERAGRVWDLSVEAVRAVFRDAMDAARWEPGPVPGTWLFHLEGGPATAGADVGIVRFEPGTVFPRHGHGESEHYVVLDGLLHDDAGHDERPGDLVRREGDGRHGFVVDPAGPAHIAIVLRGGLHLDGEAPEAG